MSVRGIGDTAMWLGTVEPEVFPDTSDTTDAGDLAGAFRDQPRALDLALAGLNVLRDAAHTAAKAKGFYEVAQDPATFTANMHSEVTEFWDAYREGRLHSACDKAEKMASFGLPVLTCAEEELADMIIRACDTAGALGVDLQRAVSVKMAFNKTRAHRHGGKLA